MTIAFTQLSCIK